MSVESTDPAGKPSVVQRLRERDPAALGTLAVIVLIAFAAVALATAPDDVPTGGDPGWIDLFVRAPVVIGAARVALVCLAAYVTLSVVWLVIVGQPLIKFGPAETAPLIEEAQAEAERLREEITTLTEERDRFLEDARRGWEVARALEARLDPAPAEGVRSPKEGQ